jgi:hypothetical protein
MKSVPLRQNSRNEERFGPMFWAGGRKDGVLQAPLASSDLNKIEFNQKVRKWGMGQLTFQQVIKLPIPLVPLMLFSAVK